MAQTLNLKTPRTGDGAWVDRIRGDGGMNAVDEKQSDTGKTSKKRNQDRVISDFADGAPFYDKTDAPGPKFGHGGDYFSEYDDEAELFVDRSSKTETPTSPDARVMALIAQEIASIFVNSIERASKYKSFISLKSSLVRQARSIMSDNADQLRVLTTHRYTKEIVQLAVKNAQAVSFRDAISLEIQSAIAVACRASTLGISWNESASSVDVVMLKFLQASFKDVHEEVLGDVTFSGEFDNYAYHVKTRFISLLRDVSPQYCEPLQRFVARDGVTHMLNSFLANEFTILVSNLRAGASAAPRKPVVAGGSRSRSRRHGCSRSKRHGRRPSHPR